MEKQYHLDNIYRNRWQEYDLADGQKFDSREIYWRQLPWEQVIAITTFIKNKKYLTHCNQPDFKFFVVYRWAGQEWLNNVKHKIAEWAVGWSNGTQSFMTDISFKTGEIIRQYVVDNTEIAGHIHPRVGGTGPSLLI